LIGFCQVALLAIGGLFSGFGKSPYSFTPVGLGTNFIYVGATLLGMELSRAWLVNRIGKRHPSMAIGTVAVLFTLLGLSLSEITGFKLTVASIDTAGSEWLPFLSENLLATLLALHAGPKASLVYRGTLAAFWWFVPVLPDLDWGLKAVIGAAVPITGMLMVNRLVAAGERRGRKWESENSFPLGWILTALASMLLAWFAVGLFPVKPSVIPTGSMVPVFNPGDIVMVLKVSPENIKLGDIIEFRTETINVVHRVIEIEKNGNFVTKGDANDTIDADPVDPRNVNGKVMFTVPKVGWVSIAVKRMLGGA
jgi:signal peptidase